MTSSGVCECERPVPQEECNHYWMIDPPWGPTSWGRCKFCGAEREFDNYWSYITCGGNYIPLPEIGAWDNDDGLDLRQVWKGSDGSIKGEKL